MIVKKYSLNVAIRATSNSSYNACTLRGREFRCVFAFPKIVPRSFPKLTVEKKNELIFI